jgi:hypothetical protein
MNPRSGEDWCAYRIDLHALQAQCLDLKKPIVVLLGPLLPVEIF